MDFGEYSVKNVKSFQGTDGYGYNASLYRGKKRVAFIIDEGCGGEALVQWEDHASKKVKITCTGYQDKQVTFEGTPEEKLLRGHIESIPRQPSAHFPNGLRVDTSWFLSELIGNYEETQQLKRWCKKQTVLKLKGSDRGKYTIIHSPYDKHVKDYVTKEFKDTLEEIVNERFVKA